MKGRDSLLCQEKHRSAMEKSKIDLLSRCHSKIDVHEVEWI